MGVYNVLIKTYGTVFWFLDSNKPILIGTTIDNLIVKTIEGGIGEEDISLVVTSSLGIVHEGSIVLDNYKIMRFQYIVNQLNKLNLVVWAVRKY